MKLLPLIFSVFFFIPLTWHSSIQVIEKDIKDAPHGPLHHVSSMQKSDVIFTYYEDSCLIVDNHGTAPTILRFNRLVGSESIAGPHREKTWTVAPDASKSDITVRMTYDENVGVKSKINVMIQTVDSTGQLTKVIYLP